MPAFVGLLPLREYAKSPTNWRALGGSAGIRDEVLPHLGIDIDAIRANTAMTGTFNVARFDDKVSVAIPHDEIDEDRLVAGVSLPIFMPAVESAGSTWTDAVWIRDANLMEAVRRGCTDLWVLWCIGNEKRWGTGALEQYVHMIELAANGALIGELETIREINERRRGGEAVHGSTEQIAVHIIHPRRAIPLDPDFVTGRISAETLVAMGYRDACQHLADAEPSPLDATATAMAARTKGCRLSLRLRGVVDRPQKDVIEAGLTIEIDDVHDFVTHNPGTATVVGGITRTHWGYRPVADGTARLAATPSGRRIDLTLRVTIEGEPVTLTFSALATPDGQNGWRWKDARTWKVTVDSPTWAADGVATVSLRDAARLLYLFEPSGVHSLGDRVEVARALWSSLRTGAPLA